MKNRNLKKIQITQKGKRFIRSGHVWVYEGEVKSFDPDIQNGEIVDVYAQNTYLGSGFYNDHSKIRVRILSKNANDVFNTAFFKRRIQYAIDYRKTVMLEDEFKCCRLTHGESDQLPGLTVDRYNNLLSVQITSLGIEERMNEILPLYIEVLSTMGETIDGVYLRNDVALRKKEGLEIYKRWFDDHHPDSPIVEIIENDIQYLVDVENGQKTGFFLDQKYNRKAAGKIAKDKNVLDCFTHTGSFGLNAAKMGASHVLSVDISENAINMAKENAKRNHLSNIEFKVCDVFELLTELSKQEDHSYDYIILDPPAFTKSKETIKDAYRGYKEINLKAMQLVKDKGYLSTCSCSHFMSNEMFVEMLHDASKDANVTLKKIESRQQAPDHPILLNVPETDYLKFYIFQVIKNKGEINNESIS